MAGPPFRTLITASGNCAPTLRGGTGERFLYPIGTMLDCLAEAQRQGTNAHIPVRRFPLDRSVAIGVPQADALAQIGSDRQLPRGLTETDLSYGTRLQQVFTTARYSGTARGILQNVLGYLLAVTPTVRFVASQYALNPAVLVWRLQNTLGVAVTGATNASPIHVTTGKAHGFASGNNVTISGVVGNAAANGAHVVTVIDATHFSIAVAGSGAYTGGGRALLTSAIPAASYPPARLTTKWDSYPAGRSPSAEPVTVHAGASGAGVLDWDSLSPITGSWGSWSGYLVVFSVAPNAWCAPAQDWGTGSVYAPAASGYYSTRDGSGNWVLAGSYSGTSQLWGAGSTYAPAASGYYSTRNAVGSWVAAGGYVGGYAQGWGVSVSGAFGLSIAQIASQFKHRGTWIRSIVVPFSLALFDPAQPADGTHNPAGTFGQSSKRDGSGNWVAARFTGAAYGGEVV